MSIWNFLPFVMSYLIGFFFKNFDIKKVKISFVNNSIIIALILLIIVLLPIFPSDHERAIQQGMFTFSSVYFAFWLAEQVRLFEERRRLKLYLGLLWQEHRFNRNRLEEIKVNYRFSFEAIDISKEELLQLIVLRFSNVKSLMHKLKKTIYNSFISSGAIISLNVHHLKDADYSDSIFNSLENSYNNLEYLESLSDTILLDFQTKLNLHRTIVMKVGNNSYIDKIIADMEKKVLMIGTEIAIAYRSTIITESLLDECLTKLNTIVSEKDLREAILIDEDKKFIASIIRKITKEEILDPFTPIK